MGLLTEAAVALRLRQVASGSGGIEAHHQQTPMIYADSTTDGSGTWTEFAGSGTATGLTVSTPVVITVDHRTLGTFAAAPDPVLEFLVPEGSTWELSEDPVVIGEDMLTAGEGFAIVLTPGATSVAYTWRRAGFLA